MDGTEAQTKRSSHIVWNRVARFTAQFMVAFVVLVLAYPVVLPSYKRLVTSMASSLLERMEPSFALSVTRDGGWEAREIKGSESRRIWKRAGQNLHLSFLGLALLPALLIATPTTLRHRLALVGVGLAILTVALILSALVIVRVKYGLLSAPDDALLVWLNTVFNTFGQLSAFLIWILLTGRVWLGLARGRSGPEVSVLGGEA